MTHEVGDIEQNFPLSSIKGPFLSKCCLNHPNDPAVADDGHAQNSFLRAFRIVQGLGLIRGFKFHLSAKADTSDKALVDFECQFTKVVTQGGPVGLCDRPSLPVLLVLRPRVNGALVKGETLHALRSDAPQNVVGFDAVEDALRKGLEDLDLR